MSVSLRTRVLLLVFLINALTFGAGGVYLFRLQLTESERRDDARTQDIVHAGLAGTIRPDRPNVAFILGSPYWDGVEDALLVDRSLEERQSGDIEVSGLALNPVGVARRPWDFDLQTVLRGIRDAIRDNRSVHDIEGGRAVPIVSPRGDEPWGGIWYRTAHEVDRLSIARSLLPWFLLSTLSLTLVSFFAVRRLVLDPVGLLAEGARRVRSGDFSVRLDEPDRRDEIAALVRSFNEMTSTVQGFNDRLADEVRTATAQARQAEAAAMTQRRLAAMGELAAGIAHEINNPLGGLQNAVSTLARGDLPPAKRERYLDLLSEGLARIGETVHRLRRFTPREARHEPIQLEAVVRDAIELVRHRAERLGVRLEVVASASVPSVPGAQNEIGQAILNVLANALDALEEAPDRPDPSIVATLAVDDDGVAVRIRDNGPGVSAEELERVQDLFYTTKEVGKGTGLGLPLVHNTLARHQGRVLLSSEEGSFFEVELWFPKAPGEAPRP